MSSIVDADILQAVEDCPVPESPAPWFLDVDGVLNAITKTAPKDSWDSYQAIGVEAGGRTWPILYSPGLVAVINRMVERSLVEVRWLTTWEAHAPARLAPAIGLQVGDVLAGERRPQKFSDYSWWKLPLLAAQMETHAGPLAIWTDDDLDMYAPSAASYINHLEDRLLAISPQIDVGLTPGDLLLILDRIAAVTA